MIPWRTNSLLWRTYNETSFINKEPHSSTQEHNTMKNGSWKEEPIVLWRTIKEPRVLRVHENHLLVISDAVIYKILTKR